MYSYNLIVFAPEAEEIYVFGFTESQISTSGQGCETVYFRRPKRWGRAKRYFRTPPPLEKWGTIAPYPPAPVLLRP